MLRCILFFLLATAMPLCADMAAQDARFRSNTLRVTNRAPLRALIEAAFAPHAAVDVVARGEPALVDVVTQPR